MASELGNHFSHEYNSSDCKLDNLLRLLASYPVEKDSLDIFRAGSLVASIFARATTFLSETPPTLQTSKAMAEAVVATAFLIRAYECGLVEPDEFGVFRVDTTTLMAINARDRVLSVAPNMEALTDITNDVMQIHWFDGKNGFGSVSPLQTASVRFGPALPLRSK